MIINIVDFMRKLPDGGVSMHREAKEKKQDGIYSANEVVEKKMLPEVVVESLEMVLEECPELADVHFDLKSGENGSTGEYYFLDYDTLIPAVGMTLDGTKLYAPLLIRFPFMVVIHEQDLGIPTGSLTPELFQTFMFLHELGHVRDWKKNYVPQSDDLYQAVDEMYDDRFDNLNMLPISGREPGFVRRFIQEGKTLDDFVVKFPKLKRHPRFNEMSDAVDLLRIQFEEYRKSPPEKYADDFAVNFLKKHWRALGIDKLIDEIPLAA